MRNFKVIAFLLSLAAQFMLLLLMTSDTFLFNNQVLVTYLVGALVLIPSDIIFVGGDLKSLQSLRLIRTLSGIVVYLFMSLTLLWIVYFIVLYGAAYLNLI